MKRKYRIIDAYSGARYQSIQMICAEHMLPAMLVKYGLENNEAITWFGQAYYFVYIN